MAGGIEMEYDAMDQAGRELQAIVAEIVQNKGDMMSKVEELCTSWNSAASERHREDFDSVAKNIENLTGMAEELIDSIKRYRQDMEQLDQSYA